ncbi:hypothetical protein E2C01_030518 [Portunus trituberculatus]|uniref:Uncharacterized protein n=1 Tax=Portunus trituberculatus TaxID=210409 RepID=A0A5B7EUG0_PORTR|nr:hypothetical protein [Portunus trituberculatus]
MFFHILQQRVVSGWSGMTVQQGEGTAPKPHVQLTASSSSSGQVERRFGDTYLTFITMYMRLMLGPTATTCTPRGSASDESFVQLYLRPPQERHSSLIQLPPVERRGACGCTGHVRSGAPSRHTPNGSPRGRKRCTRQLTGHEIKSGRKRYFLTVTVYGPYSPNYVIGRAVNAGAVMVMRGAG